MALFTKNIKHPDEFSLISGETQVIDELPAIEQSIGLILRSAKGELFGDPKFGCNLYEYLYKYDGPALYKLIKSDVAESLNKWDSRIFVSENDVECTSEPNEKRITIKITYHLRHTEYTNTYIYSVSTENKNYLAEV